MPFIRYVSALLLFLYSSVLFATPLAENAVPKPLKPWVDWVLQGEDTRDCPFLYNDASTLCVWPSALNLDLNQQQGAFDQTWQVYQEAVVRLPGDKKTWPQNVLLDGVVATVLVKEGFPVVKLPKGTHHIQGQFTWQKLPKSLAVTPESGLVSLRLEGKAVQKPEINQQGRLWLNSKQDKADERDTLEIQVYRKIIDSHPMKVETRLDLRVSGRQRDVEWDQTLLKGFVPLRLDSKLPARIDHKGKMQVQLRSGQWSITITGRSNQPQTVLEMPKISNHWPEHEVWVFEAHNDLRLVRVNGVDSIDPRQTNLPPAWQTLPAYRMQGDKPMQLKVLRRGDPEPEPDKLSLRRDLWLDFGGEGYTSRDIINGTMSQGWRLDALPILQLGRVLVDGKPQFITQRPDSQLKGVELRRGSINLQAESRYEASRTRLPVSGWEHDFSQVSTVLHLPPGWKLFSAMGMDNTPNTWLQKWTLLDLFLVLITAVAVANLWRWQWGVLALFTLALIWHEAGAPQFIWLNLIAAIALLRVVPKGIFQTIVRSYRNASFVVLLLIVIPFMINEVRIGLYPQLEKPWFSVGDHVGKMNTEVDDMAVATMEAAPVPVKPASAPQIRQKSSYGSMLSSANSRYQQAPSAKRVHKKNVAIQEVDPKANIQTGPGLPNWQWNRVDLNWSGPVEKGETVRLILLSPAINMLLNFLRVCLVLLLIWRLFGQVGKSLGETFKKMGGKKMSKKQTTAVSSVLAIVFSTLFIIPVDKAHAQTPEIQQSVQQLNSPTSIPRADLPSPDILNELKQRLLAPADCLPNCAQIERLSLQIDSEILQGRMIVHAAQQTAIPLPGSAKVWLPESVLLDGESANSVSRNANGELWLAIPSGRHEIVFQGRLPKTAQLQLVLPLIPHVVDWKSEAWSVDGINNGVVSSPLQINHVLNKDAGDEKNGIEQDNTLLPAFVSVERTLHLGLDWTVDTVVRRLSPRGNPIVMSIPLLENESVLTENTIVKNNLMRVSLATNQMTTQWRSRLNVTDTLELKAAESSGFIETWKLETSPIWHVESSGIPVVHHQQNDGVWLPTWKPWAGEHVKLSITRPKGVDGQTLTISASELNISMGKRSNDVGLDFTLRSSQGTQHTVNLPDQAELHRVSINGKKQSLRQNGTKVTLPVSPGQQHIKLEWREPQHSGLLFTAPAVDLSVASVNSQIHISLPQDRWILWASGPQLGPAVLFWGVLLVILMGSIILGKSQLTPIKTWQWFLLGIGLSQSEPALMLVVIAWLLVLASREKLVASLSRVQFNAVQIGIGLLTLIALSVLFGAVANGLLGQPDMQISGNNSYGTTLNWFQDRSDSQLAQPWVLSVPILVYRLLMLLWALWLAFTLLAWLRWGWERVSAGGLWREKLLKTDGSDKEQ